MIKGMHELGVPIEMIAKASKLSIKEVEDFEGEFIINN